MNKSYVYLKCNKCNGNGKVWEEVDKDEFCSKYFTKYFVTCDQCFGKGELDWIEVIVGKRVTKEDVLNISYGTIMMPVDEDVTIGDSLYLKENGKLTKIRNDKSPIIIGVAFESIKAGSVGRILYHGGSKRNNV